MLRGWIQWHVHRHPLPCLRRRLHRCRTAVVSTSSNISCSSGNSSSSSAIPSAILLLSEGVRNRSEMMRKENDTELKLEKKMNEAKMRRCLVAVDTVSLDTTKPLLVSVDLGNFQ